MEFKLYENQNGTNYVRKFMDAQGDKTSVKIALKLRELQTLSFLDLVRLEKIKKVRNDIYEIRMRIVTTDYRFLFLQKEHRIGWLVEAFIKKDKKVPPKHIETAEQRAKEIK